MSVHEGIIQLDLQWVEPSIVVTDTGDPRDLELLTLACHPLLQGLPQICDHIHGDLEISPATQVFTHDSKELIHILVCVAHHQEHDAHRDEIAEGNQLAKNNMQVHSWLGLQ